MILTELFGVIISVDTLADRRLSRSGSGPGPQGEAKNTPSQPSGQNSKHPR